MRVVAERASATGKTHAQASVLKLNKLYRSNYNTNPLRVPIFQREVVAGDAYGREHAIEIAVPLYSSTIQP